MEFKNINKRTIIFLIIFCVILILFGLFVFKYINRPDAGIGFNENKKLQNNITGLKTEVENQNFDATNNQPKINIESPRVEKESAKQQDNFYVCADQCGDGICQPAGTVCKDKLNCICAETPQDCPQDCKQ